MPNTQTTRPKLLFYTHGLVDGGGERLWSCLASAFEQRGYPVVFVQDFEGSENNHNLSPTIPLHTLGRGHLAATRRLADLLAAERPAIALSAIGGCNLKLMSAIAMSGVDTRAIISYHGFNEWKTGLMSFLTYASLPKLSRMAARTIGVSAGLTEQLVSRWGARAETTRCILNPVFFPQSAPVPTADELAARDDLVLAVGRLVADKDFSTLLRAFARISRPNARLVILGKGPLHDRLAAEIEQLGLAGRVELAGYCREPWTYYARAKCLVSSSSSEPFGNVIVEAMAHGLPVVATVCDGPQEILEHGQHGRMVAIGDDLALAQAIESTLDAPGDPATRRARADMFSFAVRVPHYEALVEEVLAEHQAAQTAAMGPGQARSQAQPSSHSDAQPDPQLQTRTLQPDLADTAGPIASQPHV